MKFNRDLRWGVGTVAAIFGTFGGLTACGDSFGSDDCRLSRTCPPDEGGAGGQGGTESSGGTSLGGEAGADDGDDRGDAGAGGAGEPAPECSLDADCDNEDAMDGVETCFNGLCVAGNPPPTVVAVTPEDEAVEVAPDGTISIELSEELDEKTVTEESVQLLDGERVIPGKLAYAERTITFTPDELLPLLAPLEIVLSTALTDLDGASLASSFRSSFTVRDGAWSASIETVAGGSLQDVAPSLQLTGDDRALVAWIDRSSGGFGCPATAAWYQRGSLLAGPKTFTNGRDNYCNAVRAGVSRNGFGLISWYEEGTQGHSVAAAAYREGEWAAVAQLSERRDNAAGATGAAEDGVLHYIGPMSDVSVWTSTPEGAWPKTPFVLSARPALGDVRLAVAPNGDAIAAWRDAPDEDSVQILAARYTASKQAWSKAAPLPGSPATSQVRGEPEVAFGPQGEAVVVWQRGSNIVATHFSATQEQWLQASVVSGDHNVVAPVQAGRDLPAVAFDGTTLVVAYTSLQAKLFMPHVSRYDAEAKTWEPSEGLSDQTTQAPGSRMPQLHADGQGNLLVVWAAGGGAVDTYDVAFQRYSAVDGAWSGPSKIAGAKFSNGDFELGYGRVVLGGNSRGAAAVMFADGGPAELRLASFH